MIEMLSKKVQGGGCHRRRDDGGLSKRTADIAGIRSRQDRDGSARLDVPTKNSRQCVSWVVFRQLSKNKSLLNVSRTACVRTNLDDFKIFTASRTRVYQHVI